MNEQFCMKAFLYRAWSQCIPESFSVGGHTFFCLNKSQSQTVNFNLWRLWRSLGIDAKGLLRNLSRSLECFKTKARQKTTGSNSNSRASKLTAPQSLHMNDKCLPERTELPVTFRGSRFSVSLGKGQKYGHGSRRGQKSRMTVLAKTTKLLLCSVITQIRVNIVTGWVDPRATVRLGGLGKLEKMQWPHRESNPQPSGL
jgi:hypothetical protein